MSIAERPANPALRQRATALASEGRLVEAIEAIRKSYRGSQLPPGERLTIARYRYWLQQFDVAEAEVAELLATHPDLPNVAATAAEFERNKGNIDNARALLEEASVRQPDDASITLALVDLGGALDASILTRAKAVATASEIPIDGRRMMSFALARFFDSEGDVDAAWSWVTTANGLYPQDTRFDRATHESQLDAALRIYEGNTETDSRHQTATIYVVGPPRSGGSLLQTVLAAVPGVASVGERGALLPYLFEMTTMSVERGLGAFRSRRDALQNADASGLRALIGDAHTSVDKTPHTLHVAGLVSRVHPAARFVDVQRAPAEVALSILFHDFPAAFDYSRSIDDIVDYLDFRKSALARWRSAGLEIIEHDHDSFVASPSSEGAALFERLGFEWDDSYLDPSNRGSIVQTFSATQVRKNIKKTKRRRADDYAHVIGKALAALKDN